MRGIIPKRKNAERKRCGKLDFGDLEEVEFPSTTLRILLDFSDL